MVAGFADKIRLNPFYFRAGLLHTLLEYCLKNDVLIPFISGLDCYLGLMETWLLFCLNPFYFRAGLLPRDLCIQMQADRS